MSSITESALRHALQNAILHGGQADTGAVLGKILGEHPDLRQRISEARLIAEHAVRESNSLPAAEQERRLAALGGVQQRAASREGLPPLAHATAGKVVTRFAPAPSGPLHLMHLFRAVFVNYLYARQYGGRFLLRLEDTDPRAVEAEFYDMIREDLRSVGIVPDQEVIQSDHMDVYYRHAASLLEQAKAYVCLCDSKAFQGLKERKEECPCRANRKATNMLGWKGMLDGKRGEGRAVVRLRTSMQDPNPALRDPPLLRIVEAPHPLQRRAYRVWPLYNFANALMDHANGVTHVFRGKEHEHNTAVQGLVYRALGLVPPHVTNFGMMYLPGEKMHKRDIKAGILEGRYSGWDDLRLHTVRAFLRRGFVPESFRDFSLACGLSKTDIRIDIANLEAINRKLIDLQADRYMAVLDPVELDASAVLNGRGTVQIKVHPEREETRKVALTQRIFVSGEDFARFRGHDVRLIDLCNVRLDEAPKFAKSQRFDMKTPKIQWVSGRPIQLRILTPGGELAAIGEPALGTVKPGTIIQLLRIGFGRVEKPGVVAFAHK